MTVNQTNPSRHTNSLPANLSWWDYFKKDMFGRNFYTLDGRASRKEWWAFTVLSDLFAFIWMLIISYVAVYHFHINAENPEDLIVLETIGTLINMIFAIPNIALSFRRFHDIDMSAWWSILIIPTFFLPFFKGTQGDNRFGKNIY